MDSVQDLANKILAASNMFKDEFIDHGFNFLQQLWGHKPHDDNTSSVAPMLRVAEALADLDTKRDKSDVMDFVHKGYSRALRQAIENEDWLLQVEALKSLGDLYLEIARKTGDEHNVCFAINLYLNALRHCRDIFGKVTLYHRVSHATKYITHPPLPYTAQYHLRYRNLDKGSDTCMPRVREMFENLVRQIHQCCACDEAVIERHIVYKDFVAETYRYVSEDSNTCMSRVAGMLEDLDRQKRQGCDKDTLMAGYTMMMVRGVMYTDTMAELEAIKSIGDIYLERGRAQKNTEDLSKALALYNSALKMNANEASNVALQHRIEYARNSIRRVELDQKLSRTQNKKVEQNKETRSYAELLLVAETALQNGDLDAAESGFASALQQIHDRESPRLQEEKVCLRKLGDVYVRRGTRTEDGQDFAKATALYNAALARNGDKQLLIDSIKEAERLFLYHTVGIDCKPLPYETDIQHKNRLEKYRTEVKARLETIHKDHNPYQYKEDDPLVKEVETKRAEAVRNLFKNISEKRKDFIKDLVEECITTIGPPPCQYAMVGLGSQATEMVTPYSDLEFAILIEEKKDTLKNKEYFVNLTCYLHLKIINLGETILPAVAIKSLNDFHSEDPADRWFYDSVTPRGFAFDGAMPWASKTPFGREKTRAKPAVSLIQTPAGMAEFQRHDVAIAHGYHLSSILRYVSYLTGDQTLVDDYIARVIQELDAFDEQDKTTVADRFARAFLALVVQERSWAQEITDKPLDVKREIYRFPAVTVMNLALLGNVYATSVWDGIQKLEEAGAVSKENAQHLQVLVSISGELRLRTYLELGGQKEYLSGLLRMQTQQDESGETLLKTVFHVPEQKMLFRYYYTARPLKNYIKGITLAIGSFAELATSQLGRQTFYDASSSVKADIHQGLLQFNSAIAYVEDALRELDEDQVAGTCLPSRRQKVENLHSKVTLLGQIAECHRRLGDHRKAISRLEEQLSVQQQLHDYDSKHIVRTYRNLATAWARLGNEEKFLTYFKQAVSLLYKGPVDGEIAHGLLSTLLTVTLKGNALSWINSYDETSLNRLKTEHGENSSHPVIASSLLHLGERFNQEGNYTKAITYNEKSLKMMKIIYGQDTAHPAIAASLTNLGYSLCKGQCDHVKAVRHYEQAFEMNKLVDTPHPVTVEILNKLGVEWSHLADHQKARSYLEQAVQLSRTIHGGAEACHPDIAGSLNTLGHVWDISGDNEKAFELFEQALEMYRALHGPTTPHPDTAMLLENVGLTLEKSGDNMKAISYYGQALSMMEEVWGKSTEHPNIAKVLGNLGRVYCKTGDYTKSKRHCERALEMNKCIHGQDAANPSIAESLNNLAVVYKELGDHQKAIQLYEEALNMTRTIHGGSGTHGGDEVCHPDIARGLRNLGCLWLNNVGDNEKARVFFEQTLKMHQQIYGPTTPHHDTAISLRNMGAVFKNCGDNFKAISYFEEGLKMMEEVWGKSTEHPDIAGVLGNLGSAYVGTGEYSKSIRCCERALEINKAIHGHDAAHHDIVESLVQLGAVSTILRDHTKAKQLFDEAFNMAKTMHGTKKTHGGKNPHNVDIVGFLHHIGHICNVIDDNEKARVICSQELKMCQEHYGPATPHPHTAVSLACMAGVLEESGDHVESISFQEKALKMFEEIRGTANTALFLSNIASACRQTKEYTKALQYYERALKINKGIHGDDAAHPSIAKTLSNLSTVYEDLNHYTKAIQHYEEALNMTKVIHSENGTNGEDEACHPDIAWLLSNLASACRKAGEHTKSVRYYERALEMNKAIHGQDAAHTSIAEALRDLATVYEDLGNHKKAIQFYENALNMLKAIHGANETNGDEARHLDIAAVLTNLGRLWFTVGDNEKARVFFEKTLKMYQELYGPTTPHHNTAIALGNMGAVFEKSGDNVEAISLYEEALKKLEKVFGKTTEHPDIAWLLGGLGSAYRKTGEYKKSLLYYERALEVNKAMHGHDAAHPSIADSLRNLAEAYGHAGDHTKAIQLYEEALNMLKVIHGGNETQGGEEPRHLDIAAVRTNLGCLCFSAGDNEKACVFFEQALKMYQQLYGPTTPHHNTAISLSNMGEVWGKSGDSTKAIHFYEEALKMLEEVLGKSTKHPHIARVLSNLGSVWSKTGEHTKSLQYCERALEMIEEIHGQNAMEPIVAVTLREVAAVYEDLGDHTKAIQLYEDALDRLKTFHGPHYDMVISLNKLGEALEKSGNISRAISLYEEALKMMGKCTERPELANVLDNLGSACRKAGKHTKSLQYYRWALKINKRTLEIKKGIYGEDAVHSSIAKSLSNLAKVYGHVGDHKKAIHLYENALNMLKTIHGTDETQHHPDIAGVLTNLGELSLTAGDNEKARVFFEQALTMYKKLHGPATPHLDTARSLVNMGIALAKSGENCKVISYYEEALKMLENILTNKDHPLIAWLLGNLGSACRKTGEYTKSRQYYEKALETNKAIHGQVSAHPSIAKSLRNLAKAYEHLGEQAKAIQLYEEALNMTDAIHGGEPCHPDIARVLGHLGRLWYSVGDNEKALVFFDQEMKMKRELYGLSIPHHSTVRSLTNLGVALEKSGDHSKAISCYEEALKMKEELLGKSTAHPDIAWLLGNLGSACYKAGEHTKSLQYCEKALEMIEGLHGKNAVHPNIATSLREVAAVYEQLGDQTKAIKLYEDEFHMLKAIHGTNKTLVDEAHHPSIAQVLRKLGCLWHKVGNDDKSFTFFEQSLKMNQQLYGPTTPHHDTAISLGNMGAVMEESGYNIKAISMYEEALKMLEEVLGNKKEHPDMVRLLGNLGRTYHNVGEYTKSLQYYTRLLDINKSIHGQDAAHPSIANSLCNIAAVYEDLGDRTKAIQLYEDALGRVKTVHGANKTHPDIMKLLNNLETICKKVGDQEKASSYRDQVRALRKVTVEEGTPREDTTDHKDL